VGSLELFYDLVFVFAITQVSHILVEHQTWTALGQAALCLAVVWWSWNYTTWVTNELDTGSTVVRLMLIGVMLATFAMAIAIPDAFGERGLMFAGAYVAIQCGRHLFLTFAAATAGSLERERAARILLWFAAAGVFWIAGGIAEGDARVVLWLIGLAIDYSAPLVLFRVPGMRVLDHATWQVDTHHFAERFQLFVIIALGESIVITGATSSGAPLTSARATAFLVAFAGTCALWWLYFDYVAHIAERRLELSPERTKLARDGYTYLHVVMVAGVIGSAVGDELVIEHPSDRLPFEELAVIAGGPAVYLLAHVLFRLRMAGSISTKRLVGAAGCAAAGLAGLVGPGLLVAGLVVAVLAAVIAAEIAAGRRREARGEPSPMERLEAATGGAGTAGPERLP
jgi:low temperature requirement protein LtrA